MGIEKWEVGKSKSKSKSKKRKWAPPLVLAPLSPADGDPKSFGWSIDLLFSAISRSPSVGERGWG